MLREHEVRASLNRSIPHLPASSHDRIVEQMRQDKLIGDGSAISASADSQIDAIRCAREGLYQLRTPVEAAEAAPMHLGTIQWLRAELKRVNYDLKMEERVDEFKLNECLASADLQKRYAIKSALGALKLIAP